jgi:hypothetical protein
VNSVREQKNGLGEAGIGLKWYNCGKKRACQGFYEFAIAIAFSFLFLGKLFFYFQGLDAMFCIHKLSTKKASFYGLFKLLWKSFFAHVDKFLHLASFHLLTAFYGLVT